MTDVTTSRVAPIAAVLVVILSIATLQGARQALDCDKPLTDDDIKELVAAGVPAARLRQFIASCGIALTLPDGVSAEARLRQLGAGETVMSALAPPATPSAGAKWRAPIDQREMVFIPSGRFQMGSAASEAGRDADETQSEIQVARGFWLDVTEVSNAAFQKFVLARPEWQKGNVSPELHDGNYLKDWTGTDFPAGRGEAPVVWVNWHAARAYATWAGKRLPSEAEWEYAARAGSTTTYWWGDAFEAARAATEKYTTSLDPQRTNKLGVQDMLGGVWEWTSSINRPYPYAANDGREAIGDARPRIIRGGSWANGPTFLRAANRNIQQSAQALDIVGFRAAR